MRPGIIPGFHVHLRPVRPVFRLLLRFPLRGLFRAFRGGGKFRFLSGVEQRVQHKAHGFPVLLLAGFQQLLLHVSQRFNSIFLVIFRQGLVRVCRFSHRRLCRFRPLERDLLCPFPYGNHGRQVGKDAEFRCRRPGRRACPRSGPGGHNRGRSASGACSRGAVQRPALQEIRQRFRGFKALDGFQAGGEFGHLAGQLQPLPRDPESGQDLEGLDGVVHVVFREPFQRLDDPVQDVSDGLDRGVFAFLQLFGQLVQPGQSAFDGALDPVEGGDDVLFHRLQRRFPGFLVLRVKVFQQRVQDGVRVAHQIHGYPGHQLDLAHLLQPLPLLLDLVQLIVVAGHLLQLFRAQPESALVRVEFHQALLHGGPVVGHVEHLRGAPPEDFESGLVPAQGIHLAQRVHDGHGVLPPVLIVGAGYPGQFRDLLFVHLVDFGHQRVQVVQVR